MPIDSNTRNEIEWIKARWRMDELEFQWMRKEERSVQRSPAHSARGWLHFSFCFIESDGLFDQNSPDGKRGQRNIREQWLSLQTGNARVTLQKVKCLFPLGVNKPPHNGTCLRNADINGAGALEQL